MTSVRKQVANRSNALKSTGPRTPAGKARAAQNARRHGLSLSVLADRKSAPKIEALAHRIAGIGASAELYALARRIAEAQIDLARVRRAKRDLVARHEAATHDAWDRLEHKKRRAAARAMRKNPYAALPQDFIEVLFQKPDELWKARENATRLGMVALSLTRRLATLDRYERRALSRRKFTIREFDEFCQAESSNGTAR